MRTRLGLAWRVLRGQPVMYRVGVLYGAVMAPADPPGLRIVECAFVGTGRRGVAVEMTSEDA